jgi:hypothetical protein
LTADAVCIDGPRAIQPMLPALPEQPIPFELLNGD